MIGETKLFAGTSSKALAQEIALKMNLPLSKMSVNKFSDGEIRVEVHDTVRGSNVFIIQSTCAPANDNLMELLLIADALRRSSVQKVVAVIPYFGYARQDRRLGSSRVPISAKVAAAMIEAVGIDHVITVDLHATQIQGFFNIPVDNLTATSLFARDIKENWMDSNPIIVSPDVGGVARARHVAKRAHDMELAIVDKRRQQANSSEVMNIIGDVRDRTCIIIDDMVDTAGTLGKGATALIEVGGARKVISYATHGVLSGNAPANLTESLLSQLVVTDSIPVVGELATKVRTLSIATMLADTISRVSTGASIRDMLD